MNVWSMAWRNVWRNRRRSLTAIAAMTFALWVLLLYAGIIPGYLQSMEASVTQLEVGDVQIHAQSYLENPSLYTAIEDDRALLDALESAGIAAAPRLLGGGLAASGEASAGVALRGLDVARNARVSRLAEAVAEGAWLDAAHPEGVVLGKRLAKNLGAGPGAELVVVSQAADGSLANELYTVRGVLTGIAQSTDRSAVFMTADAFRTLMSFPNGSHQILVRRGDQPLEAITAQTRDLAPSHDVQTWKERMPAFAQVFEFAAVAVYIFSFIIYFAVGILILNAMLTAVFERIREFGVLKAIGTGPARVLALILAEGAIQAAVASLLGLLLALPAMWYITVHGIDPGAMGGVDAMGVAMPEIWYGIYSLESCAGPLVMLWLIVLAAVTYPGLKAAWINPVRAMRHR